MKKDIENLFASLITKHELTVFGGTIFPDIHYMNNSQIVFEDEFIGYLLAGYVASDVYDEMERGLRELGIEITNTDGSTMHYERRQTKGSH